MQMGARTVQPDLYGADATGELYTTSAATSELLLAFLLQFEQCTVHDSPIAAAQILHGAAACTCLRVADELEGGMGVRDVRVIQGDVNTRRLPPVFKLNLHSSRWQNESISRTALGVASGVAKTVVIYLESSVVRPTTTRWVSTLTHDVACALMIFSRPYTPTRGAIQPA